MFNKNPIYHHVGKGTFVYSSEFIEAFKKILTI